MRCSSRRETEDVEIACDEFVITHINIRGWLSNKAHFEAQMRLRTSLPQIVLMNETKLDRSVARPDMDGYEVIARKDNEEKCHGGGVLVYANKSIANRVTYMGSSDDAERVWVMLHSNQGPYLSGAWKRAPSRADG